MKYMKWMLFLNFFLFLASPQALSSELSNFASFENSSNNIQKLPFFQPIQSENRNIFDMAVETEAEEEKKSDDGPLHQLVFPLHFKLNYTPIAEVYYGFQNFFLDSFLSYFSRLTTSPPAFA